MPTTPSLPAKLARLCGRLVLGLAIALILLGTVGVVYEAAATSQDRAQ